LSEQFIHEEGQIKVVYKISLADCIAIATAQNRQGYNIYRIGNWFFTVGGDKVFRPALRQSG
jgi:hypothetical protein